MNESPEVSFVVSQSHGSAKVLPLCFQAHLSHVGTTSLSWDAGLLLHIPFPFLWTDRSLVALFCFSELLFFFLVSKE